MTCSLVVGRLSMPLDEALGLMTKRRFRHLPVVEDGQLVGLVSIGDLVKVKLGEAAEEAQAMRADRSLPDSGRDRHLQHAIALVGEQLVRLLDLVEREAMRDQRAQIDPAGGDHVHQPAHALLAAGTQRGHDPVVAEAGGERVDGQRQASPEYTPRLDSVPPGLSTRRQLSKVSWVPSASIATSTPRPSVSRMISATGSALRKSMRDVGAQSAWPSPAAPASRRRAMMRVAPFSFAPAVAHRPIGPCANTATVSPILICAAFRAAEARCS